MIKNLEKGDRVFWKDPLGHSIPEDGSGPGTVVALQDEPPEKDSVISLRKDDGSEVQCLLGELRCLRKSEMRLTVASLRVLLENYKGDMQVRLAATGAKVLGVGTDRGKRNLFILT